MNIEKHEKHYHFMKIALDEAKKSYSIDEVPVGAVIVVENNIIAKSHNLMRQNNNPTSHAEIIVLKKAMEHTNETYLNNAELYVTLEPCCMCAGAISLSRIGTLIFGATDLKRGVVNDENNFFNSKQCHWRPEIYKGILECESSKLLKDFFKGKR
jgi:tRNA(adenine34) deaminase